MGREYSQYAHMLRAEPHLSIDFPQTLLKELHPSANVENRFVRLCNTFDDLVSFLSFAALGLVPSPTFCKDIALHDGYDSSVPRNHLSLCGVVVADMITGVSPISQLSPIPAPNLPSRTPGCITWVEFEVRAYMFGAVRHEPDAFTDAFLHELRARPDLFQVITRSDTDPGRHVDTFGAAEGDDILPSMRKRTFEAPMAPLNNRPQGRGTWEVVRSAFDVLYATKPIQGYLAGTKQHGPTKWIFHFKKFPVKYFVILDTIPGRPHSILSKNVAWAALRAKGLASGEYDLRKYARASDVLFQSCAEERLGWAPKSYGGWGVRKMEDELDDVD